MVPIDCNKSTDSVVETMKIYINERRKIRNNRENERKDTR